MSLPVSLFDSGHREHYNREKRLGIAINTLMSLSEPKSNKDPLSSDVLKNVSCLWIFQPRTDLTNDEVGALKSFLENGGNIIFSCAENCPPNFAAFIKSYGISISEPVISPVYIQYIDPHQVSIQQGVLNRAITEFIKSDDASFAYPNGYVLEVSLPAIPILSSGASSYPLNCPTIAMAKVKAGTLTVIGSPRMFSDE